MGTCIVCKRSNAQAEKKTEDFSNIIMSRTMLTTNKDVSNIVNKIKGSRTYFSKENLIKQAQKKIETNLLDLKDKFNKDLAISEEGIYSRYLLKLFDKEYPDPIELRQLVNMKNQVIVECPPREEWDDQGFITNGANLDEILADFLNQCSQMYCNFQIEEVQNVEEVVNIKRQDFKIKCQLNESEFENIQQLAVKFFIYDSCRSEKDLIQLIHRCQMLKLLQPVLPLSIKEEIFEIMETQDSEIINRYCVLYEIENEKLNQQISISEMIEKNWKHENEYDSFSYEKCCYYALQMLEIIHYLENINVCAYLDTVSQNMVRNKYHRISLKTDFNKSFKLYEFPNPIPTQQQKKLYLNLDLFENKPDTFTQKSLVQDAKIAEYNQRLQISLIILEMLKSQNISFIIDSESLYWSRTTVSDRSSKEKKKKLEQLENEMVMNKFLYQLTDNLKTQIQDDYKSVEQLIKESYSTLYSKRIFLRLSDQLYKEKQYEAIINLYQKLIDKKLIDEDKDVLNKFFIQLNVGKAYYKLKGGMEQAVQMLQESSTYCKQNNGETSLEYVQGIIWLAKANIRINELETALELINKAFQISTRIEIKEKEFTPICHLLYFKIFSKLQQNEKAYKHIEDYIITLNVQSPTGITQQIGKAYYYLSEFYSNLKRPLQEQENLQKAYQVYLKLYGDSNEKTQKLIYHLGLTLIKNGQYQEALNKFMYLHSIHRAFFAPFHFKVYEDHLQLGIIYFHLKQFEDSFFNLDKALGIAKRIFLLDEKAKFDKQVEEGIGNKNFEFKQFSKINYYIGLVKMKGFEKFIEAEKYLKSAYRQIHKLEEQSRLKEKEFIAQLDHQIGICEFENSKFEKALWSFQAALEYNLQLDNKIKENYDKVKDLYDNIIKIQEQLDHTYKKSVQQSQKLKFYITQGLQEKDKDIKFQVQKEMDLASVCLKLSEYYRNHMVGDYVDEAVLNEEEALKLYSNVHNLRNSRGKAIQLCLQLGETYYKLKQYDQAILYYNKGKQFIEGKYQDSNNKDQIKTEDIKLSLNQNTYLKVPTNLNKKEREEVENDEKQRFNILYQIANIQYDANKLNNSLTTFQQLLQLKCSQNLIKEFTYQEGFEFRNRIAKLYQINHKFKEALIHYDQAYFNLKFCTMVDDQENLLYENTQNLAICNFKIGEYQIASKYFEEQRKLAQKLYGIDSPHIMNCIINLIKVNDKMEISGIDNSKKLELLYKECYRLINVNSEDFINRKIDLVKDIERLEVQEFRKELFQEEFIKLINHESLVYTKQQGREVSRFTLLLKDDYVDEPDPRLPTLLKLSNDILEEIRKEQKGRKKAVKGKKKKKGVEGQ